MPTIDEQGLELLELRAKKVELLKCIITQKQERKDVIESMDMDHGEKRMLVGSIDGTLSILESKVELVETQIRNIVTEFQLFVKNNVETYLRLLHTLDKKVDELEKNCKYEFNEVYEKMDNLRRTVRRYPPTLE